MAPTAITRLARTGLFLVVLCLSTPTVASNQGLDCLLKEMGASRSLTYDEYLAYKAENLDGFDREPGRPFDPTVGRFYREHYAGRPILIFADDDMSQSSGVAVVMKNIKERIEKMSGLEVEFITPKDFKKSVDFKYQGQIFHQALPPNKKSKI